ncbi:hypothetical protein G0Q06_00940 [Puniceicoccales bacterium CK1056]|uniref:Uncharacterized protein n=1 Tax=Oceanipulchritudo coccoides TaxID=2706888 RepID=A0A6B2LWW8_9BACT|nr:hypothetical protein [Oceanipulchritudo coccoides]NDV61008.1 hypothetical protein [Oceanipulchritudo coccoides]
MKLYPTKTNLLLTLTLGAFLTGTALADIAFTNGGGTGDWRDPANWDGVNFVGTSPAPEEPFVVGDSADAGGVFDTIAVTGSNLSGAGAIINVLGTSSASFEGNKQGISMTINFEDNSRYLVVDLSKVGYDFVLNYNSAAISDSFEGELRIWRASGLVNEVFRIGAVINVNSGGINLGALVYNEAGIVNLDGGNLTVGTLDNPVGGIINFSSNGGSTFSLNSAVTVNDLDTLIASGSFTIDGVAEAESPHSFSKVLDGTTLEISVIPGQVSTWFGYDIVDGAVDTGGWIGPVDVVNDPWVFSWNLDGWMYAPAQPSDNGAWFFIAR